MPKPLSSNTKRRERYHHGDLRAGLIQAGIAQLERSGPDSLSLRGLAHQTGVSASAPYRHFPHRGDLLEAIAAEGYHRVTDLVNRPDLGVGEAAERIATFAKEHPGWWELMVAAPAELGSDLEGARGAFLGELVGIVERQVDADDPEGAIRSAVAVWAVVLGLTTLRARGGMALLDDTLFPTARSLAEAVVSVRPRAGAGGRRR